MNQEQVLQMIDQIGQIVSENNQILRQLAGGGQEQAQPQGGGDEEALRQQAIANLMGGQA